MENVDFNDPSGRVAQTHTASNLLLLAEESVVLTPKLVNHSIDLGLPSRITAMLFSTAVSLIPKHGEALHHAVVAYLSHWPEECLYLVDLLGKDLVTTALCSISGRLFVQWLKEGLLSTQPMSNLKKLYLSGYAVPSLFEVPIIWLPLDQKRPDTILHEVKSMFGRHLSEEDNDLETLLKWKLGHQSEMCNRDNPTFLGNGPIEIQMSCNIDMSEWMSMLDEMLGLMLCMRTPFRFNITRLTVNNFHLRQVPHLRWFMSMINLENLTDLGIYGYRKSVSLALSEFHTELKGRSISWFALATSGPKLLKSFELRGPSEEEEVISRTVDVLTSWQTLREIYFNRVTLRNQVKRLLSGLSNPLKTIFFYCNDLSIADLDYLSTSHHILSVKELTLERNNLSSMGQHILRIGTNGSNLQVLNLKDTQLEEECKIELMFRLANCDKLQTLVMYDSEDMVSRTVYEVIVDLACSVKSLRTFYLFPFNYTPFETMHRSDIEAACLKITEKRCRWDLIIKY